MKIPRIRQIERVWIRNPFLEHLAPWLRINNADWEVLEITRVHTDDSEISGIGETLVYYTGHVTDPDLAASAVGSTAPELLRLGSSLGVGLRMALYDVLGKTLGVPVNALFSREKVRDRIPLAWWSTKLPPEVLAKEAADAYARGFRNHKVKARPWFDVFAQIDAISAATEDDYLIELDWNSMLVNTAQALPVLRELDGLDKVALFESPVDRGDAIGQDRLRRAVSTPLFEHFNIELASTWLARDSLDGFVVDPSDPQRLFAQTEILNVFKKDCFLQMCGTGITVAWVAHMGAICAPARFPAVTAANIYRHDILDTSHTVRSGHLDVPRAPGLGVSLNDDLVESLRVEPGFRAAPNLMLLDFEAPGLPTRTYATGAQLWEDSTRNASFPVQPRGARLIIRDDDGSSEFVRQHQDALRGPNHS